MGMRITSSRTHRHDRISALLADACAPAHPAELAGEEAAVAAYRAARDAPPSPAPASSGATRRLTAGAATWLAAVAATVAAGAAVAAAAVVSDSIATNPEAGRGTAPTVTSAPKSPVAPGPPQSAGGGPDLSGQTGRGQPTRRAVTASATVANLCRSYRAIKPAQRAKVLREPGFAPLVAAAGGADRVPAYCDEVQPAEPGAKATAGPPVKPAPAEPPRGKPSDKPTKKGAGPGPA